MPTPPDPTHATPASPPDALTSSRPDDLTPPPPRPLTLSLHHPHVPQMLLRLRPRVGPLRRLAKPLDRLSVIARLPVRRAEHQVRRPRARRVARALAVRHRRLKRRDRIR